MCEANNEQSISFEMTLTESTSVRASFEAWINLVTPAPPAPLTEEEARSLSEWIFKDIEDRSLRFRNGDEMLEASSVEEMTQKLVGKILILEYDWATSDVAPVKD